MAAEHTSVAVNLAIVAPVLPIVALAAKKGLVTTTKRRRLLIRIRLLRHLGHTPVIVHRICAVASTVTAALARIIAAPGAGQVHAMINNTLTIFL